MIHAISGQEKHLEILQRFQPHFKGIYDLLLELEHTPDVVNASVFIRTAELWINSCVVTSLKKEESSDGTKPKLIK